MPKKKIVFLCVFTMLTAMFAGCNKVPTAEELVTKSLGTTLDVSDVDMVMTLEMSTSAESLTADMSLVMDMNVKSNKEVSHTQGEITIDLLGMEVAQAMESWSDVASNMTYTYNSMYDCWISTEAAEVTMNEEAKVGTELFGELIMAEVAKEDTEYVVTTTLNLGNAYELLGMNMTELLGSTESLDLNSMVMDVTMKFDRETEMLTSMSMSANESTLTSLSEGETKCTVLLIDMVYNDVAEDLVLEIPATVMEEAVSADEMMEMLEGLY